MYYFRCPNGVSTSQCRRRFKHLAKLGTILSVQGYRFATFRGIVPHRWHNTYERVMVEGTLGRARFEGLCWGYGGEGPNGLRELLELTGLHTLVAQFVAFESPRQDECGTDWALEYNHNGTVTYTTPKTKLVLGTESKLIVKAAA